MAESRHRHVARTPRRRRIAGLILPLTGALVVAGAGAAALTERDVPTTAAAAAAPRAAAKVDVFAAAGQTPVSRGADRAPLPNEAEAAEKVEGRRWAHADLDIYADAAKSSPVLADVAWGDSVKITGVKRDGFAQIMHNGAPRWVVAKHLSKQQPLGTAPCASGSRVEAGLRPDTVKVHRAVCARFPSIVRYGGAAGRGEHATGRSLDIMVSSDVGNEIAAFLQQHRAELGIEYLIWRQRIWRPSTSGSWRHMASRGSATANHYDHVHVTTYGNAATR